MNATFSPARFRPKKVVSASASPCVAPLVCIKSSGCVLAIGPYSAERNFDSALLKDAVPCVGPYCMLEWHASSAQRAIPRAKIAFPCASRCAHGAPVSRLMRPGADVNSVLSHLATLRKGSAAPGGAKLPRGPSQPVGAMGRCCLAAMVLSRAACSRARRHATITNAAGGGGWPSKEDGGGWTIGGGRDGDGSEASGNFRETPAEYCICCRG